MRWYPAEEAVNIGQKFLQRLDRLHVEDATLVGGGDCFVGAVRPAIEVYLVPSSWAIGSYPSGLYVVAGSAPC